MELLSEQDRRDVLFALQTAIGHECKAIEQLTADRECTQWKRAIAERRLQVQTFEKLVERIRLS